MMRTVFALASATLLMLLSLAAASPEKPQAKPGFSLSELKPAAKPDGPAKQPRFEDWIAEPGTAQKFQPFMLHADQWFGIDQRAKLDSIVFVLENGARCCQVLDKDSTWAVDYTWVYPHNLLPPRWYDAKALFQTGDSLKLPDDADLKLTFGTMRTAVHAGSLQQATLEAYRLWPKEMPKSLGGRLKLKVERAQKALDAERAAGAKKTR
jgi:hypothetical protein